MPKHIIITISNGRSTGYTDEFYITDEHGNTLFPENFPEELLNIELTKDRYSEGFRDGLNKERNKRR